MKEAVEEFIKNPSHEAECQLINNISEFCPSFFEDISKAINQYLKHPQMDGGKYGLKQAILVADSRFSEAYQSDLGGDDLERIYNTIFNHALKTENALKITHVKQATDFAEEEVGKASLQMATHEEMTKQYIIGSKLTFLANSIRHTYYPLSPSTIKIKKDFSDEIGNILSNPNYSKDQKSRLRNIKNDLEKFFDDRLFYDAEITEKLIERLEQVNQNFIINIDSLDIKHVNEEYCLQQAINSILEHAKSYKNEFASDAAAAEKLVEDLTNLTNSFFTSHDFAEENQKEFLSKLSVRIQEDQSILSKHHGWGDVIENIALAVSSIFVIGIIPALFKFYKRTIEGDNTFSYFPSKAEHLAGDVKKAAEQITPSTPSTNLKN